jgi:hypothetical protein
MFKYNKFINENNEVEEPKFNIGDTVKYIGSSHYWKGWTGKVEFIRPNESNKTKNEYIVGLSNKRGAGGIRLTLQDYEMELINKKDVKMEDTPNTKNMKNFNEYVQNQFQEKSSNDDIKVGDRVVINGIGNSVKYDNVEGTVRKTNNDQCYFIEVDEDISKNRTSYYALVDRKIVKKLGKNETIFKKNDKVIGINPARFSYNKKGIITQHWKEDNSYMVKFGEDQEWLLATELKKDTEAEQPERRRIGFGALIPRINTPSTATDKKITIEEEEEEEDDITKKATQLKKEDLDGISYKDFFDIEKITDIESIKTLKLKYEDILKQKELSKIKLIFAERAVRNLEIVESYFDFLIHKIAKDLPVLRTIDTIENEDLLSTKTKVKASESKELTNKYSFDQGIIAYWKFKDAVIFKTL